MAKGASQTFDLRVLADFATEAVRFALIEPTKVVAWADGMIATGDVPPAWLMELSLVDQRDVDAVVAALQEVPGESDEEVSQSLVGALVLREWRGGRLVIGRVRGIGWTLYRREYERQDLSRWGSVVEYAGDDLDNGYIDEAAMRDTIDRELGRFEPWLRRLPEWV